MAVEEQEQASTAVEGNGRQQGGIARGGSRLTNARRAGFGLGLLKGLAVTLKHLFKHNTVIQYPDVKQDLPSRTRGVIALKEENCTVCMLCGRECPCWCIYIDSHKETLPPKREGGRQRKRNVLDRFAIDYALCMYCGICVEVCPYDALFWSREFEYAEYDIRQLTHEKEKLSDWMETVLPPPQLEDGSEMPGQPAATAAPSAPTPTAAPAAPTPPAKAPATEPPPKEEPKAEAPPKEEPKAEAPPEAAPKEPPAKEAPKAEAEPIEVPQVEVPHEAPRPVALEKTEDPEAVYEEVLKEQLEKGSSPQVAEARAKVARVKAERGIPRAPTPVEVEKPVPSAPTKAESAGAKEENEDDDSKGRQG